MALIVIHFCALNIDVEMCPWACPEVFSVLFLAPLVSVAAVALVVKETGTVLGGSGVRRPVCAVAFNGEAASVPWL